MASLNLLSSRHPLETCFFFFFFFLFFVFFVFFFLFFALRFILKETVLF